MKKKSKIVLVSLVGALVLAGAGIGIGVAATNSQGSVSGATLEPSGNNVEGSGEFDWKKYTTSIPYGTEKFDQVFTSNEGDEIYDIRFVRYVTHSSGENGQPREEIWKTYISYETSFNIFDSLDVFFVFNNGFKTDVIHSSWPWMPEEWSVTEAYESSIGSVLFGTSIVEVWIRTND